MTREEVLARIAAGKTVGTKLAKSVGLPRATPIKPPLEERPQCTHPGCTNKRAWTNWHWVTGQPMWRPICQEHHEQRTAGKHGLKSIAEVVAKNAGFNSIAEYSLHLAKKAGFDSITAHKNSTHPYLKYRKSYCENIDGRFGYTCNYEIKIDAQLQVDHIDGNSSNNHPSNLQTLCANCHIFKTHLHKDYRTPGRKALKQAKKLLAEQ